MTKAPTGIIEFEIEVKQMMDKFASLTSQFESAVAHIGRVRREFDTMAMPAPQGYGSMRDAIIALLQQAQADGDTDRVALWMSNAKRMEMTKAEFDAVHADIIAKSIAVNG